MKIEKVNCLVTLNASGNETVGTQIPLAGPSAISVTEIPLIQAQNGPDAVTRVHSAGFFETEKRAELSRLNEIYPDTFIKMIYPGQNPPLPKTIDDLDLPAKHIFDAPKLASVPVDKSIAADKSKDDEIAELKAKLAELEELKADPDLPVGGGEPQTKEEWREALKDAGVEVPLGNFGIPALKAMMPEAA